MINVLCKKITSMRKQFISNAMQDLPNDINYSSFSKLAKVQEVKLGFKSTVSE